MKHVYFIAAAILSLFAESISNADAPIQPGDRIAIIGNTFADQLRIHGYLETLLLQHTRENPVSIRNLGWGGDMGELGSGLDFKLLRRARSSCG